MDDIINLFGGKENILPTIKENACKLGRVTTKMMLEIFYVMKSPQTSITNKSIIVTALAYQLLPKDILPMKKFGILGLFDNALTIAFAYNRVKSSITPQIEQQAENTLNSWFNEQTPYQKLSEE